MRASLFGLLAVFAVGCSNGAPSVESGASAEKLAPCVGVMCGAHDFASYWKLDPVDLAQEWGRPELAPQIAELAQAARGKLAGAATFADAQNVMDHLYAQIDTLAAH